MNERLGRGINALIPDADNRELPSSGLSSLPVEQILPNRYQPRKVFDPVKLSELASSIKENGIIQPVIVTKTADSAYELIAGERRLEAAKLAGLDRVPVVIRSVSRKEQLQLAIIENVQRENLNPIEEAMAYRVLIEDFELTHNELAQKMGKERATISNTLRLLNLPPELQEEVAVGNLSAGHARAVLSVEPAQQMAFAEFIMKYKLTVRQAEEKAKSWVEPAQSHRPAVKSGAIRSFEAELSGILKLKTTIKDTGGKGKVILEYKNQDELEELKSLLYRLK